MFVEKIMSLNVHSVTPNTTLAELRKIFSEVHYHHLIVVEDAKLVGVISDRDVLRMSSPYLDAAEVSEHDQSLLVKPAKDFMATKLVVAEKDTLIDAAAILLLENRISCLPIVSNGIYIEGILTWKDMLKYYVYVR